MSDQGLDHGEMADGGMYSPAPMSDAGSQPWVAPAQPPPWPPPPMRPPKPRPLLVAAAVVGVAVIAAAVGIPVALLTRGNQVTPTASGSPIPTPSSVTATQARALYQQALSATRGSAGLHYVAVSSGPETQNIVGDAGRASGRQVITFASTYGTEQFTLLLIDGTVYFEGNVAALQDQLGVPTARAPSLANKWISVSSGDGPYTVLAPGITTADQAQEMALVPTATSDVTTAAGTRATRILGTVPPQQGAPAGTGHLDVATDSHLPISYVARIAGNGVTLTSTTTFSGWGTAPPVTAPSGAVAWSTLGASQPPGGYGSGGANLGPTPTPQGVV